MFSGFPSPTWALDFQNDDYFGYDPAFAHTRATASALVQQFDGSFVQMLANEWGREGGRRVENLVPDSEDFSTSAGWEHLSASTGVTPVVTPGGDPPPGTNIGSSSRLQCSRSGAGYSLLQYTISVESSQKNSAGVWARSRTGASQTVYFRCDAASTTKVIGTEWTYISVLSVSTTTARYFSIGTRDTEACDLSIDIDIAGATAYPQRPGQTIPDPEYVSRGVLSAPYHGWGVDGVQCFATDEYGNDLRIGLGPNLTGFAGLADGTNPAAGAAVYGWATYGTPITSEVLNGADLHIVTDAGNEGAQINLPNVRPGQVFRAAFDVRDEPMHLFSVGFTVVSGAVGHQTVGYHEVTLQATASDARLYFRGELNGAGDTTVAGLSIREVYPVRAAGIVRRPQITNLARDTDDFATWTKRGACTATGAYDAQVESYVQVRGVAAAGVDDVFSSFSVAAANAPLGLGMLMRAVTTTGVVRITHVSGGPIGAWSVDLSLLSTTSFELLTNEHPAVTQTSAFAATAGGGTGLQIYRLSGATALDFDVAHITLDTSGVFTALVPNSSTASVTADADVITLDKDEIGYSAAGGVWVIEHTPDFDSTVNAGAQSLIDLYTSSNERALLYNRSGDLGTYIVDGAAVQWAAADAAAEWTAGQQQRVAWRVALNDGSLVSDGVSRLADASMTVPDVASIILGGSGNGDATKYSGTIERIAYYKETV